MEIEKAKEDIKKLSEKIFDMQQNADRENRELTQEETGWIEEARGAIESKTKLLPQKSATMNFGGGLMGGGVRTGSGPYVLTGPNDPKDWKSLFGKDGYKWPDKNSNFFAAVFSGRHHPGLIKASMSETTPSSGGFLVPSEQAERIHSVSLENELVMPRCYVQPMKSNTIKIPGMVIGDNSTALFGGFIAGYVAELGTIDENSPKARAMQLTAKKLTGLIRFSAELEADTPNGMGQVETLCGKGLGWYRDKSFLKGVGAGEPLGILNSPCLVVVSKEGGQDDNTIIYENLTKMMSRMFAGSFSNSVWVCHQTTIPQLLSLSLSVGTGGAPVPVLSESNGSFTMLTRPVLFTEKVETLGTQGDIGLYDFSQYVVGLRNEMRFDTSIHVHFQTDELLSRIIERHDGQSLWDSALTLADGSTTVSPFVVLEDR